MLVWVFGGLVAAALPLAVGAIAIFGAMAALRVISFATDVSIFALNLAVAMGLALAIDYTLLLLSRFRDERAAGAGRDEALVRTMAAAGRTVVFSAMTVALSMSTMVLFPIYALKSFAYAGVAVVAFASLAAPDRDPGGHGAARRPPGRAGPAPPVAPVAAPPGRGRAPGRARLVWYRLAMFAMRGAVPIGLAIVALLVALGIPFTGVKWGLPDDRVLPGSSPPHVVGDQLRTRFADDPARNVTAVLPEIDGVAPAQLDDYAAALSRVPDVSSVSAPGGTFVSGGRVGPPSAATAIADGRAFFTVTSTAPLFSRASEAQLDHLQAVPGPAGRHVLIDGTAQVNRDTARAIASRLPLVLRRSSQRSRLSCCS